MKKYPLGLRSVSKG